MAPLGFCPRPSLSHSVIFTHARGKLSSSQMCRHNILPQSWFPLRHSGFFPKAILPIRVNIHRVFPCTETQLGRLPKGCGLLVCLSLSQCHQISLLLPHPFTLRLLGPPVPHAHGTSKRCSHHLGGTNSGQQSKKGLQCPAVGVQTLALTLSVHVGLFIYKIWVKRRFYLISLLGLNDIICVKMHVSYD